MVSIHHDDSMSMSTIQHPVRIAAYTQHKKTSNTSVQPPRCVLSSDRSNWPKKLFWQKYNFVRELHVIYSISYCDQSLILNLTAHHKVESSDYNPWIMAVAKKIPHYLQANPGWLLVKEPTSPIVLPTLVPHSRT